jgi:hypothetical protein
MLDALSIWELAVPTKAATADIFVFDSGTGLGIENAIVEIRDDKGNHSHGSPYITDGNGHTVQLVDCEWELVSKRKELAEKASC